MRPRFFGCLSVTLVFLCPRCRAGLCDRDAQRRHAQTRRVSMPSMSGGALRRLADQRLEQPKPSGFYALDVGRGFATATRSSVPAHFPSVSMPSMSGGFATPEAQRRLGVRSGVSMPSCRAGLCDLRRYGGVRLDVHVSMPSVSGGGLRRMPISGTFDLRFCGASRQPFGKRTAKWPQNGHSPGPTPLWPAGLCAPTEAVSGGLPVPLYRGFTGLIRWWRAWWSRRSRGWSGRRCRSSPRSGPGCRRSAGPPSARFWAGGGSRCR